MGYKSYNLESPEDLNILKKYFTVKGQINEEEHKTIIEIHEEYEVFNETHIYHDKEKGRILIMKPIEGGDYDELLLFSPLGTLETLSSISFYDATELGKIIEKILNKNIRFRNNLINALCETRRGFNASFMKFFNVNFDFFTKCESIAEINPFCLNRNDFKDSIMRISEMLNSYNKKKIEKFLDEKVKGSIDALRKVFQKADKAHDVTEDLHKLSIIHSVRNTTPVHSTDKYFSQFLRKFGKEYPEKEEDWCDLSIFVLRETSIVIERMSKALRQ